MNEQVNSDSTGSQDAASSSEQNEHAGPIPTDNGNNSQIEENLVNNTSSQISTLDLQQVNGFAIANSNATDETSNISNGENLRSDEMRENGSGSESFGLVESMNEESGNRQNMQDRLSYHQNEQEQLSSRLRESLVRRQELMVRYQATRERLNNLKQQRSDIADEERNILRDAGAPETPYEDPIPGAENWTELQLENSIEDFRILRNRVDSLHEAYKAKLHATDENNTQTINDIQRKIEKVLAKRCQIENAISRMIELLATKQDATQTATNDSLTVVNSQEELAKLNGRTRASIEDDSSSSNDLNLTGAERIPESREELVAKQKHLQDMRDQLAAMKQLLAVTSNDLNSETVTTESSELAALSNSEEPILNNTVIGVNGDILLLSDSERRDPLVVAKFKQLAVARERLAKMEEVMNLIADARDSGKPIQEILSPENFAVLVEAQEDERLEASTEIQNDTDSTRSSALFVTEFSDEIIECTPAVNECTLNSNTESHKAVRESSQIIEQPQVIEHPQVVTKCPQVVTEYPQVVTECPQVVIEHFEAVNNITDENPRSTRQHLKKNQVPVNEIHDHHTEWEREQQISAMHYRLKKKTTSGISSVNDGSRVGTEKGAIKKQPRNLFCEGSDPRVTEMLVLQEELKEKKNALETLMKKMGKSFTLDNFSDNISENVSDLNSETFERPTASWGDARYLSDPSPSDVEVVIDPNEDLNARFDTAANAVYSSLEPCAPPKNKDSYASKIPQKQKFSVNNLSDSLPRSVRSKQNRTRGESVPVTTWENISENKTRIAHDQCSNKVQNTVFSAMTQLTQVQETINSLYEELRSAERATSMQANVSGNMFPGSSSVLQPNTGISFAANPQNMMENYQQLMNSQVSGGLTNPMMAGLQQCYSQLYLHSLEIQSLNKHLQVRPSPCAPFPFFNPFFYPPQPPM